VSAKGSAHSSQGTGDERRGPLMGDDDEWIHVRAIHYLQIVGEAAARVSLRSPVIPPGDSLVGRDRLRNVLVRQCFGIDLNELWVMVSTELPAFMNQIRSY
jgi:uncharacterized protein with HEPN domain